MTSLRTIRGYAFDLDGTIWAGPRLLPGAAELVADLRHAGLGVVFASNSSRYGSEALARELTRLGIRAEGREVVAAFDLTAAEVLERVGPSPLLAIGTDDLAGSLARAGHEPLPLDRWSEARAVVVGNDPRFDFDRLRAASRAVAAGAAFFAVNLDARYPVADGFDPGCGALAEAVATASRTRPIVVGKPHPRLFESAVSRLGLAASEVAMIGDSQASDIVGGKAVGMFTVWVAPHDDIPAVTRPDLAVAGLPELHRLWLRAGGRPETPGLSA
ncbi:HAD-IIA family hydrolase [Planctomyces sp. SH-PL62]|uniref:HAD-IIA family hydrolase n=1 Tax=Planctomyces sp. SH-PL62 TaxID=1636152 RepID=UPI00078C6993|nr:HAD-IIA family hydrolase [Planctomyces sp. SH-PL62]AMV38464.1 putative hydrolase YutF [Planctomyces sp. SH-PL62]